jgi:alpha(1,3/1,4) fucosyltransferase
MNLGFYNFYRQHNQNRIFQSSAAEIGDDLNYAPVHLAQRLKALGHGIATIDTAPLESFDAVVFVDYPTKFNAFFRRLVKSGNIPLYLLLCESPAVRPDNWKPANHAPFEKVFTWSPGLADGRKYIRIHMAFKLPDFRPYAPSQADKFCCLIASQKYSWVAEELYSERVRAIRWFEKHHSDEFDLYGQRWDRFFFKRKLSIINPILNLVYRKCPRLPRRRNFPSARGCVTTKREVMRQYKFSICYENASYPGWLTEKMLDAMFAGSVPIYLGDPEVTKFVPKEAFIDKREFPDYDSLYRHLKGMSPAQYEGYREAIHHFVNGETIKLMGPEAFTEMILREVINHHKTA